MTTEAATQPGVEVQPTGNTDRDNMIAQLANAARKERDEEIRANGGEVIDTLNVSKDAPETETDQAPDENPVETEQPKAEEKPVEAAKSEPQDDYITVKVDGQERQVPKSMILEAGIKTVQKESAADRRLEEATKLLREAQEAAKPKQPPLPVMDEVELAQRIRMGNDQEAAEAMRVLVGRSSDAPTPEQIAAAVEQRVIDQMTARQALQKVQDEYKDVFADPYLRQLAAMEDARMLEAGDTRSYSERYSEIGKTLSKYVPGAKGGKAEVTTSSDKQERKASITNLPSASVRQAAPEQPKAKTTAQIIEEMRARRGQAA